MAINRLGDALSSGGSVYESDDDIYLVGDALPFSLKLLDSLVAQSPQHSGLLLSASRGYLLYSYAYIHEEANRIADDDLERANETRARANRLYLRSLDYAFRALENRNEGFIENFKKDPAQAVTKIENDEHNKAIAELYSAAAALGLAIATAKQDAAMLARLPEVEALLQRALSLDESWNQGALHEFAVTWNSVRPGFRDANVIREHYERALTLSQGRHAGVYIAYAEAVALPEQDRAKFKSLLDKALSVNLDADPNSKLLNVLSQRRARWLLSRLDHLFVE